MTERNLILEAQHVESELFEHVAEAETKSIDKLHEREMTHAEALSSKTQYLIRLKTGRYLDCAFQAQTGRCRASMINTPRELFHGKTGLPAQSNISLYCEGDCAFIVANGTEVPALTELFFGYGNGFRISEEDSD